MLCREALISFGLSLLLSLSVIGIIRGQNEITTQRASLQGLQQFYLTVNVETGPALSNKQALDVTKLQEQAVKKLRNSDLPVRTGETPRKQDHAQLIIHINTMNAGRGIVPFAVNIDLYQPVKLTLNRNIKHSASTWNTGNVGVVSRDKLETIPKSALGLLEEFIQDYKTANQSAE